MMTVGKWLLLYGAFIITVFLGIPLLLLLVVFLYECLLALKNRLRRSNEESFVLSELMYEIIRANLHRYRLIINCKEVHPEWDRDEGLLGTLLHYPRASPLRRIQQYSESFSED